MDRKSILWWILVSVTVSSTYNSVKIPQNFAFVFRPPVPDSAFSEAKHTSFGCVLTVEQCLADKQYYQTGMESGKARSLMASEVNTKMFTEHCLCL